MISANNFLEGIHEGSGCTLGINEMSDMTWEEFQNEGCFEVKWYNVDFMNETKWY